MKKAQILVSSCRLALTAHAGELAGYRQIIMALALPRNLPRLSPPISTLLMGRHHPFGIAACPGPMQAGARIFTVATNAAIVALIERARRRLVVIAPALTRAVADALATRFNDLDRLDIRGILDADAERFGPREFRLTLEKPDGRRIA